MMNIMTARGFQSFVPNLACSYDDTGVQIQAWGMPKLAGTTCVSVGVTAAPASGPVRVRLCSFVWESPGFSSTPVQSIPHHWAACASVPACTRCGQISDRTFLCASRLGANLFEFDGGCDWLAVHSHACVWSVGYLFSKIYLCAIVCSSCNNTPADSCSNGVRFHTSMSKWKTNRFLPGSCSPNSP